MVFCWPTDRWSEHCDASDWSLLSGLVLDADRSQNADQPNDAYRQTGSSWHSHRLPSDVVKFIPRLLDQFETQRSLKPGSLAFD